MKIFRQINLPASHADSVLLSVLSHHHLQSFFSWNNSGRSSRFYFLFIFFVKLIHNLIASLGHPNRYGYEIFHQITFCQSQFTWNRFLASWKSQKTGRKLGSKPFLSFIYFFLDDFHSANNVKMILNINFLLRNEFRVCSFKTCTKTDSTRFTPGHY